MKITLLLCLLSLLGPLPEVRAQGPAGRSPVFPGFLWATIPHDPALNAYPLTVTAWVATSRTSGTCGIVNKYLSGAFCGWQLYLVNGDVRAWYFADATNNVWDGTDGLNGGHVADGHWHHLAFTVGPEGGTIYVDGQPKASQDWNGVPTPTAGVQDLQLGAYPGGALNVYGGQMDEVTVWNARLSGPEIEDMAYHPLRGDEAGLVAYYRFDESGGALIQDSAALAGHQAGLFNGEIQRLASQAPLVAIENTEGLPVILRAPAGREAEAGTTVTFQVKNASDAWKYQWMRNGQDLDRATNSALVLAAVSPDDAGDYRVRVWTDEQSLTSPAAPLQVLAAPEWLAQPVGTVAAIGESVAFTGTAQGGRPLSYRWYRDGVLIAGAGVNRLVLEPVLSPDAGDYHVVASNAYGSITSRVARLKLAVQSPTHRLVLHLNFDGQLNDSSGRNNHATYVSSGPKAVSSPTFIPGRIGQAFQFTTTSDGQRFEYATLGYPPDLQLGANDDFTVAFWSRYSDQAGDPPLLSNKDWDKSHKPGWAITAQNGGNFRVNASGPNRGADFLTVTPDKPLRDGAWHHVAVSFPRTDGSRPAWVYTYWDGRVASRTAVSLAGTVDTDTLPFTYASPRVSKQTSWALNIGQDGTGVYFDKGGASIVGAGIDDLGIWRRALSTGEIGEIYSAGLQGRDLTQAAVSPELFASQPPDFLHLSWSGDPRNHLETTADLGAASWLKVPASEGSNALSLPMGGQPAFFRVVVP